MLTTTDMNYSIGVDIEKIDRFAKPGNNKFIALVFSKREIEQCKRKKEPHIAYAGKFCAKEAVIKAFDGKIEMKKIEILNTKDGKPEVYVAEEKRSDILCSISHTEENAIAFVLRMR